MTEIVITSSVLILVLTLVRYLLRGKFPLRLQYGMWAVVALRLLAPVSVGSLPVSVLNAVPGNTGALYVYYTGDMGPAPAEPDISAAPTAPAASTPSAAPAHDPDTAAGGQQAASPATQPQMHISTQPPSENSLPANTTAFSLSDLLIPAWYAGMAVMGGWFLSVNLSFRRKLRETARRAEIPDCPLPVFVAEDIPSPCLVGLFRPAIYVTPACLEDRDRLRHVLAHELTHWRHKDPLWSLVRCLCLTIYWFHPLVWLAASLSRRDCELACDEGALAKLGEEERTAYGRTLIGLVAVSSSPTHLLQTATTMVDRKRGLKERLLLIAQKPRVLAVTAAAVVLVCAVTAACTFTGAVEKGKEPSDASLSLPNQWQESALPLFDNITLGDRESLLVLDSRQDMALVSVDTPYPEDSPYYSEGGGLSSHSDHVYLLSYPDGAILADISLPADTYCGSGAIGPDCAALQLISRGADTSHIVRYPFDGSQAVTLAQSGASGLGPWAVGLVCLDDDSVAYTFGPDAEGGVYGFRVVRPDGTAAFEYTQDAVEGSDWLNVTLVKTAQGVAYGTTREGKPYVVVADGSGVTAQFALPDAGSLSGLAPLSDGLLLAWMDTDGNSRLIFTDLSGTAFTYADCPGLAPCSGGELVILRSSEAFYAVTGDENGLISHTTGAASPWRGYYWSGSEFWLFDWSRNTASALTPQWASAASYATVEEALADIPEELLPTEERPFDGIAAFTPEHSSEGLFEPTLKEGELFRGHLMAAVMYSSNLTAPLGWMASVYRMDQAAYDALVEVQGQKGTRDAYWECFAKDGEFYYLIHAPITAPEIKTGLTEGAELREKLVAWLKQAVLSVEGMTAFDGERFEYLYTSPFGPDSTDLITELIVIPAPEDGSGTSSGPVSYTYNAGRYEISGYDAAHMSWMPPNGRFPKVGQLYYAMPRFLGSFFRENEVEGSAELEDGVIRVGFTVNRDYVGGTVCGPYVSFKVDMSDGILERSFTDWEGYSITMSDEAMIQIARALREVIQGVEAYHNLDPTDLTQAELDWFNTEFFNCTEDERYMNNIALISDYAAPADIDLYQLFYNGATRPAAQISDREREQLARIPGFDLDLDVVKITTSEMDAFLQEKLGLSLEETAKKGLDSFQYLPDFDAYYLSHGDTNYDFCTVTAGRRDENGLVTLSYEMGGAKRVVTLREDGENYLFLSNERAAD